MATQRRRWVVFGIASLLWPLPGFAGVDETTVPKNVEQAMSRLAAVFGSHDPKDGRQFRAPYSRERVERLEPGQPQTRDVTAGVTTYGNAYRVGDAACFDVLQTQDRTVYRAEEDGRSTVLRRQQRYFLARVSLHATESGVWEFQFTFLGHSTPKYSEKCHMKGAARWLPHGLVLAGAATDEAYSPAGGMIPHHRSRRGPFRARRRRPGSEGHVAVLCVGPRDRRRAPPGSRPRKADREAGGVSRRPVEETGRRLRESMRNPLEAGSPSRL
jgi:hypothetical protein